MIRRLLSTTLLFLFLPLSGWAALLYMEPAEEEYYQGDTFVVKIRLDTQGECINAIEANLSFDQDVLEAIDFSQGDSILTLWLESPSINQSSGLISFSGGIPAGFCGRLPGDPGDSDLLGRIIFKASEDRPISGPNPTQVEFLATSQVLLNDGLGTPASLSTKKAVFTIMSGVPEAYKQEWQEELAKDKISPEDFEIKVNQNQAIFEDKYFIVFSAIDKQTGLDYFEVKEGKRDWKKTTSPYLLNDQSLSSIIKVKAVDKAGNERIAEYLPLKKPLFTPLNIALILINIVLIVSIFIVIKRRKKTEQTNNLNSSANL